MKEGTQMSYPGHVKNGVVIFDESISLPDGTEVRVEPVAPMTVDFWQSSSLDELARRQGSVPLPEDHELFGGWPEEELNDGFEDAVAHWRELELERGR